MPEPLINWLSARRHRQSPDARRFRAGARRNGASFCPKRLFGIGPSVNRFIATLPLHPPAVPAGTIWWRGRCAKRPRPRFRLRWWFPAATSAATSSAIVARIPQFCRDLEILFVEGGSKRRHLGRDRARQGGLSGARHQAVCARTARARATRSRKGFAEARGEALLILDADMTMPPEELPKFYERACLGQGRVRQRHAARLSAGAGRDAAFQPRRQPLLLLPLFLALEPALHRHAVRHQGAQRSGITGASRRGAPISANSTRSAIST